MKGGVVGEIKLMVFPLGPQSETPHQASIFLLSGVHPPPRSHPAPRPRPVTRQALGPKRGTEGRGAKDGCGCSGPRSEREPNRLGWDRRQP